MFLSLPVRRRLALDLSKAGEPELGLCVGRRVRARRAPPRHRRRRLSQERARKRHPGHHRGDEVNLFAMLAGCKNILCN